MTIDIEGKARGFVVFSVAILFCAFIVIAAGYVMARKSADQLFIQVESYQQDVAQKNLLLSQIQSLLGYGGIIHNFKNFVIRRNPASVDTINLQIDELSEKVSQYRSLTLSATENHALGAITEVVSAYQVMLLVAQELDFQGAETDYIDRQVRVSDTAAIEAIVELNAFLERDALAHSEQLIFSNARLQRQGYVLLFLALSALALSWLGLIVLFYRNFNAALISIRDSIADLLVDDLGDYALVTKQKVKLSEVVLQVDELVARGTVIARHFKINQKKLRKSEATLNEILDSIPESVIITNNQGDIIAANRAALNKFSTTDEILKTKRIFELMPMESSLLIKTQLYINNSQADQKQPLDGLELTAQTVGLAGKQFPINLTLREIVIDGERSMIFSIHDLTMQKIKEETFHEIIELSNRANQTKTHFLASVSHELRTPLNSIMGFTQLLLNKNTANLSSDQLDNLNEIHYGGRHLLNLVNDVLDLAQIEAGELSFNIEKLDAGQALETFLNFARIMCTENNIELIRPVSTNLPTVLADKTRLRQALINLLSNAVKYNTSNGLVEVTCEVVDEVWFRVTIRDTGIGIDPAKQGRIFNEFDRLDIKKSEIEGVGIGLSLTKKLVEGMGGHIDFISVPGKGTTFWIDIRVSRLAQSFNEAQDVVADGRTDLFSVFVLTTDDEVQQVAEGALAAHDDIRVTNYPMADTALLAAMLDPPDVVVIDSDTVLYQQGDLTRWLADKSLQASHLVMVSAQRPAYWPQDDNRLLWLMKNGSSESYVELKREVSRLFDATLF